ncbi:hypothetical protein FB566_1939 [Stackebrandtia endophytica]|uniref:Uncharacterized protein n=1 Tax=Stackebrandtia endophytica TaxID=1496996 RepID=A0A543AV06_9ACTN|nr:hypothetical protein [Stackebrandtia endophytica]TQL76410.1 hypothetical protein FB566_1939 [Stackebrandtia endophytica]
MSGQWRQDGPSTPDRIKTGASTTLDKMRGGKTVAVAVAAVAVVLVAALVWATMSFGGSDSAPPSEPAAESGQSTEESETVDGLFPDGNYQMVNEEGCLGLAEHGDVDRWIIAARACDAQQTYFTVTFVADDTVRIGFVVEGFTEFCLRADGPELDDDEATQEDLYYFAPYECDESDRLQEFQLTTLEADGYQVHTAAGQCVSVFLAWSFPDGRGVGTAPCAEGNLQSFQFSPL